MREKVRVSVDEVTVGMRWDEGRKEIMIGGPNRFAAFMETLLEHYLKVKSCRKYPSGTNTRKYYVKEVDRKRWNTLNRQLAAQGIVCEVVSSFGTLMR